MKWPHWLGLRRDLGLLLGGGVCIEITVEELFGRGRGCEGGGEGRGHGRVRGVVGVVGVAV